MRLRSYGEPLAGDSVFVELKKKYKGIVYKRRVKMELTMAERYLYDLEPAQQPSQITKEIDWFLKSYKDITPAMYISYNRIAMYSIEDPELRITFDSNIHWREEELWLGCGAWWGNPLLEEGQKLMEIKIPGAIPLWLSHILDELEIALLLTGCGSGQGSQTASSSTESTASSTEFSTKATEAIATTISTNSKIVVDTEFKAKDLEVGYDDSTATHITLDGSNIEVSGNGAVAENGVLTIKDEGTYVVTGTLQDGQIVVDAQDTDKVQIVLNGVSITCSDNAPIYIKNADKVYVTLQEKTHNTLIDGIEYVQSDDNTVDGVIFSMSDLTINGNGSLNVTSNYENGIVSKDDLIITGGTFNITAVKDAINGKDDVKINNGTFTLSAATGNGIQSKNGDDSTKGYVYISGGNITIVKCKEGIEGTAIIIAGGTIDVTAEEDGFNAASGTTDTTGSGTTDTTASGAVNTTVKSTTDAITSATTQTDTKEAGGFKQRGAGEGGGTFETDENCYISITGGTIKVNASGDGLDSNGNLYISGGSTYVSCPTNDGNGGIDYNGTAEITGGTIVVTGSSGMAQGFSDTSSQYSLLYNLTTACDGGTEVKLTDKEGNVVASDTPDKQYQSVVISKPELTKTN